MTHNWHAALAIAGVVSLCACSAQRTVPVDTMATTQAEQAIQRAADADAEQYSPLELRKAREKLEAARAATDDHEYERAVLLAQQAEVDAQLAEVKSEAAAAKKTSEETRRNINALQQETTRSGSFSAQPH